MNGLQNLKQKKLVYLVTRRKDPKAFGELYDLYVEKIFRFVYYKISNREEAEDLTGDIFLKAWQYLISDGTEKVDSFNAFIYRIARNCVIDVYRRRAVRQECPIDMLAYQVPDPDNIKERVSDKEQITRVLADLRKLKQDYQDIIFMKYIEELSTKEIAAILDKSQANVRVTAHRALKVLKKMNSEDRKKN